MARLITKFKYLKPSDRMSVGGYAKYIATREGVDKIDDSQRFSPATGKQKELIEKLLKDFPDSRDSFEYEDYQRSMTIGSASEFITHTIEENAAQMVDSKTYADYIATRPRAQRFGSHGLFTDDGVQVQLSKVSKELNLHEGNVWTAILSLRREDAERLGYNNGERWRDMLRTQTEALSTNLHIPMQNLKWFAAFHNESHHPHVHLIAYSTMSGEGYLTKDGVMNLRSSFAKDIFAQDLISVYEKQTEHRDDLKTQNKGVMAEIISQINSGIYDNPRLESMLTELADRLSKTSGKKVYGYLKADVKDLIDRIVDELAADERIAKLYDLWYEQRENVIRTYTEALPERVPLSQNKEFKSVRNMVITEAMNIVLQNDIDDLPDEPIEAEDDSAAEDIHDAERETSPKEKDSAMWKLYCQAKDLLDKESESYDPNRAVGLLIEAANMGCGVAKYRLGKMFLRGDDVAKNIDYALRWLEESAAEQNPYAEYLLGKTFLRGEDVEKDLTRAEELLRRSVNQSNQYAAYTLGKAYLDGRLLSQDISEAIRLLTFSADRGFSTAQYVMGKLLYRGEVMPQDIQKALQYLENAAEKENPYAAYLAGKIRLTEEAYRDAEKAVRWFQIAAEEGNNFAEYMLGKMYLYGNSVEKDYDTAIRWLTASAEHGNQYAAQLLHSILSNRNWSAAMGSLRLLQHLSRIIQNSLENERKGKQNSIDRKLRRKIEEKKQAHGLKLG